MIEEKEILIHDVKTNFKIGGRGEPLLILHGWSGSSDSWKAIIEHLSNYFLIISPDFPGFGKSSPPSFGWNLNNFVQWLEEFVKKLNLRNFFLLGHSFGGRVAIKFLISNSNCVKKLILVSSAGIKPSFDLKTKIIFYLAKIGNAIFSPKPLTRFRDTARNFFYLFLKNRDYPRANGIMKEILKKIIDEDLTNLLSQITQPTVLIWGKKDKIVPLKYAFIFKEKIKNSKLIILPNVGHSPHLEFPEEFSNILIQVLRS